MLPVAAVGEAGRVLAYASRTGTRRNLEALRRHGWRLVISATGSLRHEGFRYGVDNGAWSAFQKGEQLNIGAFNRALDLMGEGADWIVLPDIVGGGQRSLDLSLAWLETLSPLGVPLLIAVQDGIRLSDLRPHLDPRVGIFVGGCTDWKLDTLQAWGQLAAESRCWLHVGRVNSCARIRLCAIAGADSFDGSSATWYAVNLNSLDMARRQPDLFGASLQRRRTHGGPDG